MCFCYVVHFIFDVNGPVQHWPIYVRHSRIWYLREFWLFPSLIWPSLCVVSRAILTARAPSPSDVSGHPVVKVCWLCDEDFFFSSLRFNNIFWVIVFGFNVLFPCSYRIYMLIFVSSNFVVFLPLCRNHTMFHKRLSASVHCPWSFLKQNNKNARMLRFEIYSLIFD